jgi:hypothetical protein
MEDEERKCATLPRRFDVTNVQRQPTGPWLAVEGRCVREPGCGLTGSGNQRLAIAVGDPPARNRRLDLLAKGRVLHLRAAAGQPLRVGTR